jgi:hypothetical protein
MKIKEIYYRWKARLQFINHFSLEIAKDDLLKDWITTCIIERKQEHRRKELVEMQNKINEDQLFVKWLKSRKIF